MTCFSRKKLLSSINQSQIAESPKLLDKQKTLGRALHVKNSSICEHGKLD
jgi:hypothetical protein